MSATTQFLERTLKKVGLSTFKAAKRELGTLGAKCLGQLEKRKPFHAFRCELTVGNDHVTSFDGCPENFNHCSLRSDL